MREIKYRGRWSDKKHWVYGGIQHGLDGGWAISANACTSFQVDQESIGQFTGLHDKNGKEIYEGDIVEYRDFNTRDKDWKTANVYWMAWGDWAHIPFLHPFGSPVAGKPDEEGRSVNTVYVTPSSACEVIGNIHENPELLK